MNKFTLKKYALSFEKLVDNDIKYCRTNIILCHYVIFCRLSITHNVTIKNLVPCNK